MTRRTSAWRKIAAGTGIILFLGACASLPRAAQTPAWEFVSLSGTKHTLADFRGRTVFINMWATWCKPCIEELASIQELHDSVAHDSSVVFLLVATEDRKFVEPFIKRRNITVPVYIERTPSPTAWGLEALPTTYVLSPKGEVVLRHRGAANWNTSAMKDFLHNVP